MDRLAEIAEYNSAFRNALTDEDFLAAGYTPDEISAYRGQITTPGLSQQDLTEMQSLYGDFETPDYTIRDTATQRVQDALIRKVGMDPYQAGVYARRVMGDPNAQSVLDSLGLADFTPLGAAFAVEEGSQTAVQGYERGDPLQMGLGVLETGLGLAEAFPLTKTIARGISGVAAKMDPNTLYSVFGPPIPAGGGSPLRAPVRAAETGAGSRAPVTFDDVERAMAEAAPTAPATVPAQPRSSSLIMPGDPRFTEPVNEQPLADIPRITPRDLRDARIIPTVADLTAAGRDYTGIDASKLDVPEGLFGGPGYPLLPSSQQAGLAWAVDAKSIGTKKTGKGADLIAISAMNPDSHKSNTSVVNSIIKTTEAYVRDGRITPDVLDELDAAVRQSAAGGDPALAKLERFPGFRSPNIDEFIRGSSFEARSRIADIIGNKTFQGKGLPNVSRILQETVEKKYAGANPRDVLFFIEPDFSAPPVDLAAAGLPIHPSYRYGIRGRVFGALDQNISTFEMFPTFWGEKNIKAFGPEFNNGGRRAFDLTLPIEEVTGKQVEDLERLLTYEAAKEFDLSAIDTRILVNSMTDRWRPTTTPVTKGGASPQKFVDAIQNNKYRPALTNYTPQEVKAGARSGDLVAYQLGDDDVFFAIDAKPDYSWAGVEMQPGDKALVGVVSNAPGSKGTAAPSVIAKALDEGVNILDAFAVPSKRFPDGYLPEYYGEFGFEEVGRVPFDKEMYVADHGEQAYEDLLDAWRSDGWDESMGMPPVIVMRWSGTDADRAATAAGIRGAGAPSYRAESGGTYFEARGSSGRVPDETVQQGATGDGRGASGSVGNDNRANLSRRAREGAEGLLGLTPQQLRNKGIPEDQIQQLMELRNIGR